MQEPLNEAADLHYFQEKRVGGGRPRAQPHRHKQREGEAGDRNNKSYIAAQAPVPSNHALDHLPVYILPALGLSSSFFLKKSSGNTFQGMQTGNQEF